jgi:hypothetical protein
VKRFAFHFVYDKKSGLLLHLVHDKKSGLLLNLLCRSVIKTRKIFSIDGSHNENKEFAKKDP